MGLPADTNMSRGQPQSKAAGQGAQVVVRERELQRFTETGWALVESYEIEVPSWDTGHDHRGCSGHPPREADQGSDNYSRREVPDQTPYFTVRQRRFRLQLDEASSLAKAARMFEAERAKHYTELDARRSLGDRVVALEEAMDTEKALVTELEEALEVKQSAMAEAVKDNRARQVIHAKMEKAFAKLRRALGTERCKEILG